MAKRTRKKNAISTGAKVAIGIAAAAAVIVIVGIDVVLRRLPGKSAPTPTPTPTPTREWVIQAEQDNFGDWYWIARSGVEMIDSNDVPTDRHTWPTEEIALIAGYDYITKILREKVL